MCVCVCMYMYIHTHTHTHTRSKGRPTHFLDNHMVPLVNDKGYTHQFNAWSSKLFNYIQLQVGHEPLHVITKNNVHVRTSGGIVAIQQNRAQLLIKQQ